MIPLWLTAIAFCSIAFLTGARTYAVLAIAAMVNIYVDNFTSSTDQYLMVTYSAMEFFTCLAVLYFGDVHKLYQSAILFLMTVLHFVMEAALVFDNVFFIESGIYTYTMSALIIFQLWGADRGMGKIHWTHNHRGKAHRFAVFDSSSVNFIKKD